MDVVILIPAFKPQERLIGYVDELAVGGFRYIVVVDDGSGESYSDIFGALKSRPFCEVIHHEVNQGKGVALKTGLKFIRENYRDSLGVLTADADGQHLCDDCVKVAEALIRHGDHAIIGSRNFTLGKVPFRSWIGNRWSSISFAMVLGRWLADTQTGLRAFPMSLVSMLAEVQGERYEYEMGVLMAMVRNRVPIKTIPITTVYENGNASSHFSPLKDTIRINCLVLSDFIRFAGVSVSSFILDQCLAWGFAAALHTVGLDRAEIIWTSGFAARLVSSVFNFSLNRSFVFKSNSRLSSSVWKYGLLCAVVIVLSNCGVMGLTFIGLPRGLAKFLCDTFLYFAGYSIQSKFIFQGR
ncbi:MAG: glycosyltransferase [Kiritimatiellae bacterium]|nr:glycosyltransferase [Kiritimatiellia bacterium]